MKELRGILVGLVVVVTFPIWIVAFLLYKIFEKPSVLTPSEVEEWLRRMDRGEMDDYWWDDFLSVPIMDQRLDAIRERCEEIWMPDSGFLSQVSETDYVLNAKGKKEIEGLIEKCQQIKTDDGASHA